MKRFLEHLKRGLLVCLICANTANAAVSVGVVGTTGNTGATSTSTSTVTGVTAVAGQPIVVITTGSSAMTSATASDSVNGSTGWTCATTFHPGNAKVHTYCYNLNPLSMSGATITITPNTANFMRSAAAQITGATVTAVDVVGAGSSGTGTSGSVATGTLAQANEVVIGTADLDGAGGTTVSNGTGFTALTQVTAAGGDEIRWAWKVVAATTTSNYDLAWTTSQPYSVNVITLEYTAGGGTVFPPHSGLLLGVGERE